MPTVVLGYDLWTTVFDADPDIVGREVVLNRQSFSVVGIAAEGMRGFDLGAASYFVPIATQPLLIGGEPFSDEQTGWLTLLGRRATGATLDQVQAELRVIAARIDQEQPPRQTSVFVEAGRPVLRPGARPLIFAAANASCCRPEPAR